MVTPQQCTHSSYLAYFTDKPTKLKRAEVLDWFGGKEAFIDFHSRDMDKEIG